jgi:DNA-binding transcriptional regulator GbsR (MarR family)
VQRDAEWFVEQMGLAAESDGFPRIGGRMFGHLIMSPEPRSLDDMARGLGVSKASVSTAARRFLELGIFERVGVHGDRRDFYRIAPDFFARLLEYRMSHWERMQGLVEELRRRVPELPPAVRARLDYMEAVQAFVREQIQGAIAAWGSRASLSPVPVAPSGGALPSAQPSSRPPEGARGPRVRPRTG